MVYTVNVLNFKHTTVFIFKLIHDIVHFRFSSSEFYPVDGKGYMAEFQPDCIGTYHNFGYVFNLIINSYKPGVTFVGHRQTV